MHTPISQPSIAFTATDSSSRWEKILFVSCALLLIAATVMYLAFMDRQIVFDEVGLANPVYMFVHYGRMVYPAHGHFDDMTVHPPTHYLAIALLMRSGFSLFHAASILAILFFVILAALLYCSTYRPLIKITLLCAVFLGAIVWNETFTIRPDLELTMSWITGLIALECARQRNWDRKLLFLGSLFLTYASAVHYPGFLAFTSIFFYLIWMWISLPQLEAKRTALVVLSGVAVIGLPYLVLFAIPFRWEIVQSVLGNQGSGGLIEAIRLHLKSYDVWRQAESGRAATQPFVQLLLHPLWRLAIPAAFLGPPLLLVVRATRPLAIACLPQVLFIALGARHKQVGYSGYFAPEMVVYLAGILTLAASALQALAQRLPPRWSIALPVLFAAGLTAGAIHDRPAVIGGGALKFVRDQDDLDLSRAAARSIVGPNALVASSGAGVWYTSGGDHFYNITPDILYPKSIKGIDLKRYFSQFDDIVIDNDQTWATWNQERINVTSEYVNRNLSLRGFWFADRRAAPESGLSTIVLGVSPSKIQGYAASGKRVYHFSEQPGGNVIYYSAVCPNTDLENTGQFSFYDTFFLPSQNNDDPRGVRNGRLILRTLLTSKEQFNVDVAPKTTRCKVRDQVVGSLSEISREGLISILRRTDKPIHFYKNIAAAMATSGRIQSQTATLTDIDLTTLTAMNGGSQVTRTPAAVDIRLQRGSDENGVYAPVKLNPSEEYVYVRGEVARGGIGMSLRSPANEIVGTEYVWERQDGVSGLAIPVSSNGATRLLIRNIRPSSPADVILSEIKILGDQREADHR